MKIGMPTGTTRVVGEDQGYFGLPIRDEVINCSVNGENTPAMITAWYPSPEEIFRLQNGGPILVRILGTTPPPMSVEAGTYSDARQYGPAEQEPVEQYGVTREGRPVPRPEPADPAAGERWLSGMDYAALEQRFLEGLACVGDTPPLMSGVDTLTQEAAEHFKVPYEDVTREQRARMKSINFTKHYFASAAQLTGQDDLHRRKASEHFGVPYDEVTPEQRKYAKDYINFGSLYGTGHFPRSPEFQDLPKDNAPVDQ